MTIRRHKLDIVFSNLIRERANWYCERCAVNFRHGNGALDCAHIMGRRNVGTRWHPANAVSLCRHDHMYFTEHPFDFANWVRDHIGEDRLMELRLVANQSVKWTARVREDIYQHYKVELVRLERLRADGEMQIINIVPHPIMHEFQPVILQPVQRVRALR